VNHPLARAIRGVGMDATDVAARLRVDPKTVGRWLAGRVPYPRHRAALAQLTGWTARDLWPNVFQPDVPDWAAHELRVAYPHRSAVPADAWRRILANAEHEIGVLAYSALFLAEDVGARRLLRAKAQAGVRVRIALGDPEGERVAKRGVEEGIGGDVMIARVHNALMLYEPLMNDSAIQLRLHDTILYSSIYHADDEFFVNTHVYGYPASHGPVFHLRRTRGDGMVATYAEAFERVWMAAREVHK
jgi:hypothetical protein